MRGVTYRRARSLVCYWSDNRFVIYNYASRIRVAADSTILPVLHATHGWVSARSVAAALPGIACATVQRALDELVRLSLLESSQTRDSKRDAALRQWDSWMPEAAAFHFGVRDVQFTDSVTTERALRVKTRTQPPPPALKSYRGSHVVALPSPRCDGELIRNLLDRRTWRRFDDAAVTKGDLGTLLGLTWGVQAWVGSRATHTLAALKTAPSGGARHSIEAYVVASRVADVPPGLYHYEPDRHHLTAIGKGQAIASYIPGQTGYARAAALVLMTSIFERSRWRYGYPRAYRSIMFEAGHHCQTFLLLATSLGLAPFCTGALADSLIERDLGIDGIAESVIYACGVGARPPGVEWAPSADGYRAPVRRLPAWAKIARKR